MSQERLDLANWVLEQAKKMGADEVAVNISNQRQIEIECREKKLETLKESTQSSLAVDIYIDSRYSSQSTNDLRQQSLLLFLEEAIAATRYLTQDKYRSLPAAKYYAQDFDKDLQVRDAAYERLNSKQRIDFAQAVEAAALAVSDRIISCTAGYNDVIYDNVKVHSNGLSADRQGTNFSAGAEVTVHDPDDGRPEDWFWANTRFYAQLPPPEMLGQEAARRALQKIGQKKVASGRYTMLVENRTGGQLLGMLRAPMAARALQQKSSWLEGMLDQKIASEKLTLIDDPFIEKGLGSRLYDSEGLASQRRIFIEKGVLRHYFVDNYYGQKLGMEPTTGSPSNVLFEYGARSLDTLLQNVARGIFVTGFLGGNSNATTGDFSFGITGLLVENGRLLFPVNEMNVSGNAKEFWQKLVEMGNDPYPYSAWQIPTMVFEDVSFSGI